MKISFDAERCCSSGMCESFAPDIFEVDDNGYLQILVPEPSEDERSRVETAISACPTEALSLSE